MRGGYRQPLKIIPRYVMWATRFLLHFQYQYKKIYNAWLSGIFQRYCGKNVRGEKKLFPSPRCNNVHTVHVKLCENLVRVASFPSQRNSFSLLGISFCSLVQIFVFSKLPSAWCWAFKPKLARFPSFWQHVTGMQLWHHFFWWGHGWGKMH